MEPSEDSRETTRYSEFLTLALGEDGSKSDNR